ncbi:F-box/FBD/LRR-repeat protein At5g22660-like isoform X2 [Oryza glaberrima]|uniref:F-box/FBD/LRR-repeat protein At5g22660-like isoform X2 n=1 Tax=Oryza glaberrima TaxID=4538 RepID=UPI00224BF322|nr:F-box/FBD/LRR-repeat protein At5g22660-like isoform X2 [Oryza glaberrima]
MEGSSSNNMAGQSLNWRTQISQEARNTIIEMTMEKLLEEFPVDFPGRMKMIQDNATNEEDKTYMVATSKADYVLRIALQMVNSKSKRNSNPLLPQDSSTPINLQQQHRVAGHNNGLVIMQPHHKQASDGMVMTKDDAGHMLDQGSSINTRNGSIDRISNLPNELLYAIMSTLPALELVYTGMLSTRWRHLWTSSAYLNIDVNQFGRHRGQKFCNFVNRMLRQRGSSLLDALRLHSADTRDASSWITYAIKRSSKVVEFSEDIDCEPFKLDYGVVDFTSICLKFLVLNNVCIDANVFYPINSSCPALENLELRDCSLEVPEISSGSLLHLDIDNCCLFEDLLISSSSLMSLCIKNPQHRAPMIMTLPCLEVAIVILDEFFHSTDDLADMDEGEEQDGEEINHGIVSGLTKARSIELIAPLREDKFEMEIWTSPMFDNLISLTLGEWCMSNEFSPLLHFLWYSPLLEDLTLKLNMEVCEYCLQEPPTAPPLVKEFTADYLKKITIYFWLGDERVSKLLTLLAPICKSLEDIKLIPSTPPGVRAFVSRVQRIIK